jgi:hypothetical protein
VDEKVKGGTVEHIVVTTANGVFKLIDGGRNGIVYINLEGEERPLNELKFK